MQFYILLHWSSKIGWLSEFPYYDVSSCESKLYYAYVISGMALSGQKLDDWAGEWLSFSATLPFLPSAVKMADNVDKTDR